MHYSFPKMTYKDKFPSTLNIIQSINHQEEQCPNLDDHHGKKVVYDVVMSWGGIRLVIYYLNSQSNLSHIFNKA